MDVGRCASPNEGILAARERVLGEKAGACGVNTANIEGLSVRLLALMQLPPEHECCSMD